MNLDRLRTFLRRLEARPQRKRRSSCDESCFRARIQFFQRNLAAGMWLTRLIGDKERAMQLAVNELRKRTEEFTLKKLEFEENRTLTVVERSKCLARLRHEFSNDTLQAAWRKQDIAVSPSADRPNEWRDIAVFRKWSKPVRNWRHSFSAKTFY